MFDDSLLKNRALLDYQKSLFGQVAILELFQRGDPTNLVQTQKKLLFRLLLDEIRLEIMFDDDLVQNRALLHYQKSKISEVAILEFIQRGDPMNLVHNRKTTILLFSLLLDEICLAIKFDDHLVKNRALLHYEKSLFCQVAILEFFQRGDLIKLVQI